MYIYVCRLGLSSIIDISSELNCMSRELNVLEQSHASKITKDRSKCLRTNKCVLDKYLMNDLPEEVVEDSAVLGLQFAGKALHIA